MQFSNDKFTEIYKTINNKESKKKISNPNSTISKKTTKTRKRHNSYFLDDTEIQENTQQTQSQRKISDPNSALFLISQENQNQKKVEKKNEFPFPDNKSTKRNTHNKRNRKEKYQNLILTKT